MSEYNEIRILSFTVTVINAHFIVAIITCSEPIGLNYFYMIANVMMIRIWYIEDPAASVYIVDSIRQ